jgi:hypothetical protein
LTLTNVAPANAGNYQVVPANNYNSTTSSLAALTVLTPGPPTITAQPASQSAEVGDDVYFIGGGIGMPTPGFQWYFNGLPVAGATNSTLELDNVQSNNVGTYFVSVTNIYGFVNSQTVSLASVSAPIYYTVVQGSFTNYNFQGDTTYYINSTVQLYGTTIIEGGTVIKFGNRPAAQLDLNGPLNCMTTSYHPALLTSRNDNLTGGGIDRSTGNPTNNDNALYFMEVAGQTNSYHDLRIKYAGIGISATNPANFWDCQFVQCGTAVAARGTGIIAFHNVLISQTTNCVSTTNFVAAEFLTADQCVSFCPGIYGGASLTNSLLTAVANTNGVHLTASAALPSGVGVYQVAGAGNYYLATNTYQGMGIGNVSAAILADIATKTTWPPIVYNVPGINFSSNLTLFAQALRDTNSSPTLGYHYPPLDYVFGSIHLTNATIVVNPGTAIGVYSTNGVFYGIAISGNASFTSSGLADNLVHIVEFNTVQEQEPNGWQLSWFAGIAQFDNVICSINCQFTDWSVMAHDVPHFCSEGNNVGPFNFQDCQFHGGQVITWEPTANFTNCLFERVECDLEPGDTNVPVFRNNLIYGGTFGYGPWNVNNATVRDNLFDRPAIPDWLAGVGGSYIGGNNAFITNCATLDPTFPGDIILTNSPIYQTSWFGRYYLPPNSPLVNSGSTNAGQVALFHFTTQTNQAPESNSVVDIGYHYIATDGFGRPLDANGDGVADYVEDPGGQGVAGPQIQLVSPASGANFEEPATVLIQPMVSDWSSSVTNVAIYVGTNLITASTNASYTYSWPGLTAGAYSLFASAQDAAGLSATSAPVNVTVTNLCGSH